MDSKDVIFELRTKKGLSQDELAREICVTRQAVSRWENGETIPKTETLKQLSRFLVLHGFLGDWLRVAGNDKYFIIVKKCSSLRYP